MPGRRVLCSMLSIVSICVNVLELGHQVIIADVWVKFWAVTNDGAKDRPFYFIKKSLENFIGNKNL